MSYQILIVDDDVDFRAELSDYLHGYHVLEASCGEEALRLIRKPHAIDLVMLDVVMPGTNGIEVLKEMKRMIPDLGVIILTGKDSKDVIIDALRGNADDFLEKPMDLHRLAEAIENVLKKKTEGFDSDALGKNHKMERVKAFVDRNYDKMVSLNDVAAEVYLSPKYLSRVFKKEVGMGFKDYQLKIRIQKAQTLLKNPEYTIHQISAKVGYKNLESFIRLFKKNMGMTPTVYRQQQRKIGKKIKNEN